MSDRYDYSALNKRLNETITGILKTPEITELRKYIKRKGSDVYMFLFGGALRDLVSGSHLADYDILIMGNDQYTVKDYIRRKNRGLIVRNSDYFGDRLDRNSLDVMKLISSNFGLNFDFVFSYDIPDTILDFDINGMYLLIDDRNVENNYSWKNIRIGGLRCSNRKLKQMFQNIVDKKCTPTSYILGENSTDERDDWTKAVHCLTRTFKMLKYGYQIQYDDWEMFIMKQFGEIKWAIDWVDMWYCTRSDEMKRRIEKEPKKYKFCAHYREKLRCINNDLKQICLDHIASVSITLIPMELPIYVQLWILEYEFPLGNCLTELERIRCLEKVRDTWEKTIVWRQRDSALSGITLSMYLSNRRYPDDDDD